MMIAEFAALALACAPLIHPATLAAVVQHESGANRYAIGVNQAQRLAHQPETMQAAINEAKALIAQGTDFDAGLGQINVRNWRWLGLTAETVFDPCRNLAATQAVLSGCYARALQSHHQEQQALRAALSCYNTGDLGRGLANGYVGKVLAQAGVQVPAIVVDPASTTTPGTLTPPSVPPQVAPKKIIPAGAPDGFSANPTADGFMRPAAENTKDTTAAAAA